MVRKFFSEEKILGPKAIFWAISSPEKEGPMSKNKDMSLVDGSGRVIVPKNGFIINATDQKNSDDWERCRGSECRVVDPDPNGPIPYLERPDLEFRTRMDRIRGFYPDMNFMSVKELEDRCKAAIERVIGDYQIANLLKGPHFPFVLPQLQGDLGMLLKSTIVPAMRRSYQAQFPARTFYNHCNGDLAENVTVEPGTRQELLIQMMSKKPVCGVYFPAALHGYDFNSATEIMKHLPDYLMLSGMEVPAAVTLYPEVLGRGIIGLDMSALRCSTACRIVPPRWSRYTYIFCVKDGSFAAEYLAAKNDHSSGLSILG